MADKDKDFEDAVAEVPEAKPKEQDVWGHEGRSRPRRSVDLDAPLGPEPRGASGAGLQFRAPSALTERPPPEPSKARLFAGIGVGVAAAVVVLVVFASGGKQKDEGGGGRKTGAIAVSSIPPGAEILLAGQPTGKVTPADIPDIPVDSPVDVSVRLAGYIPEPATISARIPLGSSVGLADFRMQPAKILRVFTEPPGAMIELDDRLLTGSTPMSLPALVVGKSMEITLKLAGHRPQKVRVFATDTSSISRFTLEPARMLEITSEPIGSRILLDDEEQGLTPQAEIAAPLTKFTLKIERPGFQTYVRKFTPGKKAEKVSAQLKLLSLDKMPLSAEDKRRVKELQGDLNRAKIDLAAAKSKKAAAEAKLDQELKKTRSFVSDTGKYQEIIDRADSQIEELEQRVDELSGEWDAMLEDVLARLAQEK